MTVDEVRRHVERIRPYWVEAAMNGDEKTTNQAKGVISGVEMVLGLLDDDPIQLEGLEKIYNAERIMGLGDNHV